MSDLYTQGMQQLYNTYSGALPYTLYEVSRWWYINRTPLYSRIPKIPIDDYKFYLLGRKFRPRATTLTATITNSVTTMTLADASLIMNGDVLEIPQTGEAVEVVADPNIATNVVTVRRGIDGTTATAISDVTTPPTVYNVGNSRTGGEVFQKAIVQIPTRNAQFVQTFQHVVSIGGILDDIRSAAQNAVPMPFDRNRMDALQNLVEDIGGANQRPKQGGLRNLIVTNNKNVTTTPSAYTVAQFVADVITPAANNGGQVDLCLVSGDIKGGMASWGFPLIRIDAAGRDGAQLSPFGVQIDRFRSPYVGDIQFVTDPMLRPGTMIGLTSGEVRHRVLRDLDWLDYGRTGDAREGHWLARMGTELDNEAHHTFVTGVTGFAAMT
jgi:hypothetical protein